MRAKHLNFLSLSSDSLYCCSAVLSVRIINQGKRHGIGIFQAINLTTIAFQNWNELSWLNNMCGRTNQNMPSIVAIFLFL